MNVENVNDTSRRLTALKQISPDIAERERCRLIAAMDPQEMCFGCDCDLAPLPADELGVYVLRIWGGLVWRLLCPRCADRRPRWFGGGRVFKPTQERT